MRRTPKAERGEWGESRDQNKNRRATPVCAIRKSTSTQPPRFPRNGPTRPRTPTRTHPKQNDKKTKNRITRNRRQCAEGEGRRAEGHTHVRDPTAKKEGRNNRRQNTILTRTSHLIKGEYTPLRRNIQLGATHQKGTMIRRRKWAPRSPHRN